MVLKKWQVTAAVVCLVGGPVGQLAQYLVSPIKHADGTAAQVAAAAANPSAMRLAVWLDLPILLIIPAILYAGHVAGAASSRVAAIGTSLAFVSALGAGYLLAQDVVLSAAAAQPDRAAATRVADMFSSSGVITTVVIVFLVGHLIGFVMLGTAMWRSRAVPVWAAGAVAAWPVAEMAGEITQVSWVAVCGFALLVLGFGACAAGLTGQRLPSLEVLGVAHAG